jgi:hypothetical protein
MGGLVGAVAGVASALRSRRVIGGWRSGSGRRRSSISRSGRPAAGRRCHGSQPRWRAGVEATDLRPAELEPRGVALLRASGADGRSLVVKVYGRDAWDGQLLTSTWSYLWYRDESAAFTLSRRQQVEHEAFVTLLAERAGVSVFPVIAAGVAGERDGVLVLEAEGRPLGTLAAADVTDGLLHDLWRTAVTMHEAGIAHGGLDADRIFVAPDGSGRFTSFQAATPPLAAGDLSRPALAGHDRLIVGDDRAVGGALERLGTDALSDAPIHPSAA